MDPYELENRDIPLQVADSCGGGRRYGGIRFGVFVPVTIVGLGHWADLLAFKLCLAHHSSHYFILVSRSPLLPSAQTKVELMNRLHGL